MPKDKFNKKRYYMAAAKADRLSKVNVLQAGLRGFLCTSDGLERNCVKEAYNVLNEFAEAEYGPEFDTPKADCAEDDDDIDASLKKEVEALNAATAKRERRFQNVMCGAKCIVFIKTTLEDPSYIAQKILEGIKTSRKQKSRSLIRMLPINATCKSSVDEIMKTLTPYLDKVFTADQGRNYDTLLKVRNNSNKFDAVLDKIDETIHNKHPLNRRWSKHPDAVISINVIQNVTLIGVIYKYIELCKYNMIVVAKPPEPVKTEETSCDIEVKTEAAESTAVGNGKCLGAEVLTTEATDPEVKTEATDMEVKTEPVESTNGNFLVSEVSKMEAETPHDVSNCKALDEVKVEASGDGIEASATGLDTVDDNSVNGGTVTD